MLKIALLVAGTDSLEDGNYLRFANELLNRSIDVSVCIMDTLSLTGSAIEIRGFKVTRVLADGASFPNLATCSLESFSHIWILSLGFRASFLDKYQLLFSLNEDTRFVNSLDAIMHLKSKYFLASKPDLFKYPVSFASSNPDVLRSVLATGDQWIAKPPAGSLGRDVYLIKRDDPNANVILESLCGSERDQFALLQAYVPEIEQGEKRVIFAAGKVVGQYLRLANKDHRTNVMQGAKTEPCELTADETAYCERLGVFLKAFGAGFVGLDLAFPWIIEFNVINPGGLLTIAGLTGNDLTGTILDELGFIESGS